MTPTALDPRTWILVRDAFCEALGLEEDEVEPNHLVIGDLEAESLDFLDIAFRLERAFDIKIPRGGIEQAAHEGGNGVKDGCLTASGVGRLAEVMPEVPIEDLRIGMRLSKIPELFQVVTFYNLVVRLTLQRSAA